MKLNIFICLIQRILKISFPFFNARSRYVIIQKCGFTLLFNFIQFYSYEYIIIFYSNFFNNTKCYYRFFSTYITLYLSSTNSIFHIKERGNLITDKLTHYTQITARISLIIKRTIYEALVSDKFRNIYEVTRSPIITGSSTKNIVGTCYNVVYARQKFIIFIIIYFVSCYIKRWSFFSSRYNVSRELIGDETRYRTRFARDRQLSPFLTIIYRP